MIISAKGDAFGATGYANSIDLFSNDTSAEIKFRAAITGTATVAVVGTDLVVSLTLGSTVSITIAEDGDKILPAGGKLVVKKSTSVALYTPQCLPEWSDPVFLKDVCVNANTIIAREMSYRLSLVTMGLLGVTTVADIAAGATVNISEKSLEAINGSFGQLNVIG